MTLLSSKIFFGLLAIVAATWMVASFASNHPAPGETPALAACVANTCD